MKWRAVAIGVAIGAVIGAVVPFAVELYFQATGKLAGAEVLLIWPSSIMLLATESMPVSEEWRVFVPSVAINSALYALVGGAISYVRASWHREV